VECGAVPRALHHEAKLASPAVLGLISGTAKGRK